MGTMKFDDVSNIDASPVVLPPVGRFGGKVRVWMGNDDPATGDLDVNDVIVLCRVPWDCRPISLKVGGDSLGDALNADIGLYYPDGTVIDADEFGSAVDLDLEVLTEVLFESAAGDLDRVGERLWEYAGLSAKPITHNGLVDICLTPTTSTNPASGTIAFQFLASVD